MPADKKFVDNVVELVAPLGVVTSKPMFGGYGIFHDGDMFALISGTGLFFKADASNLAAYQQAGSKQYKPMPYYQVPAEILADTAKLLEWAKAAAAVAHASAKKKR